MILEVLFNAGSSMMAMVSLQRTVQKGNRDEPFLRMQSSRHVAEL